MLKAWASSLQHDLSTVYTPPVRSGSHLHERIANQYRPREEHPVEKYPCVSHWGRNAHEVAKFAGSYYLTVEHLTETAQSRED